MTSDEKPAKLDGLRAKVRSLKRGRDELNKQLRAKRDELRGFYNEIDNLLDEAIKQKKGRDETNRKVSEFKKKRDETNIQIVQLNKRLKELKAQAGGVPRKEYERLKGEYDKLNWKLQTSPLNKEKELALTRKLDELEATINEYEATRPMEKEIAQIEKKLREVRQKADAYHKSLLQNSEEGEKCHAEMHDIYKKVDERKKRVRQLESEFIEFKKKVENTHNDFVGELKKLKDLEGKMQVKRSKVKEDELDNLRKRQDMKEREILSELRKGKVIKTEDLLFLQGGAK
jgi:uncharacterized coiled-coil DUF342 family protein